MSSSQVYQDDHGRTVYFREEQRFQQKWLWILVLFPSLFLVVFFGSGMFQQLLLGRPWGSKPMSDTELVLVGSGAILFVFLMVCLFYYTRLITEVGDREILVRFVPFMKKTIPFDTVRSCRARTYSPIREYGGWGIRYGKSGRAYNVSGNRGVQLELYEGKPLLIGSQCADDLAREISGRIKRFS